jgi:hypothetical protein
MPGTVLVSQVEAGRSPTTMVRITQSAGAILAGASCGVKREEGLKMALSLRT